MKKFCTHKNIAKTTEKLDLNESLILNNLKNLEKQYNSSY